MSKISPIQNIVKGVMRPKATNCDPCTMQGMGWVKQPKLDGIRCLYSTIRKKPVMMTRNFIHVSDDDTLDLHLVDPFILDGELFKDVNGNSWYYCFDIVWGGDYPDIRNWPLVKRIAMIEYLDISCDTRLLITEDIDPNIHPVEGEVWKDPTSAYVSGESSRWLKIRY